MTIWDLFLTNPLFQMALLASLGASLASGVIGSFVVVKRIVSISGSIAHAVLSGLGCALWIQRTYDMPWLSPLYGALVAAVGSALVMGWVHLRYKEREDAVIAMIWSSGMAIGVIFASQVPGYNVELMNFLLGNILWVSKTDLWILLALDGVILTTVILLYDRFVALCFDEKQAVLQGLKTGFLYMLLLVLIALSIVLLIHIVGVILVLSMLAIPASIAGLYFSRISWMIYAGVLLNIFFSVGGMVISYHLDWPAGATIALFASVAYVFCLVLKKRRT